VKTICSQPYIIKGGPVSVAATPLHSTQLDFTSLLGTAEAKWSEVIN